MLFSAHILYFSIVIVCILLQHNFVNGAFDGSLGVNAVVMSPSAATIIVAAESGKLYKSKDYGYSWDLMSNITSGLASVTVEKMSMSDDSQVFMIATDTFVSYSVDAGISWSRLDSSVPANNNFAICVSGSGKYLYYVSKYKQTMSSNYGASWHWYSNSTPGITSSMSCSDDGRYVYYHDFTSSRKKGMVSYDYSENCKSAVLPSWYGVVSESGKFASLIGRNNSKPGSVDEFYLTYTFDYGYTWDVVEDLPQVPMNNWFAYSASTIGKHQLLVAFSRVYVSTNYGSKWSKRTISPSSIVPITGAVSKTGQIMFVGTTKDGNNNNQNSKNKNNGGYLWSEDYGETFEMRCFTFCNWPHFAVRSDLDRCEYTCDGVYLSANNGGLASLAILFFTTYMFSIITWTNDYTTWVLFRGTGLYFLDWLCHVLALLSQPYMNLTMLCILWLTLLHPLIFIILDLWKHMYYPPLFPKFLHGILPRGDTMITWVIRGVLWSLGVCLQGVLLIGYLLVAWWLYITKLYPIRPYKKLFLNMWMGTRDNPLTASGEMVNLGQYHRECRRTLALETAPQLLLQIINMASLNIAKPLAVLSILVSAALLTVWMVSYCRHRVCQGSEEDDMPSVLDRLNKFDDNVSEEKGGSIDDESKGGKGTPSKAVAAVAVAVATPAVPVTAVVHTESPQGHHHHQSSPKSSPPPSSPESPMSFTSSLTSVAMSPASLEEARPHASQVHQVPPMGSLSHVDPLQAEPPLEDRITKVLNYSRSNQLIICDRLRAIDDKFSNGLILSMKGIVRAIKGPERRRSISQVKDAQDLLDELHERSDKYNFLINCIDKLEMRMDQSMMLESQSQAL